MESPFYGPMVFSVIFENRFFLLFTFFCLEVLPWLSVQHGKGTVRAWERERDLPVRVLGDSIFRGVLRSLTSPDHPPPACKTWPMFFVAFSHFYDR